MPDDIAKPLTFEKPFLLLCEGPADCEFYKRLLVARGIGQEIEVICPADVPGAGHGRDAFTKFLQVVKIGSSFSRNVKAVLAVGDADDDQKGSFEVVRDQLEAAGYARHGGCCKLSPSPSGILPYSMIYMVPQSKEGCLETIWLEAMFKKHPLIRDPLDEFMGKTPAKGWGLTKQEKMRASTVVAATCKENPGVGFSWHWIYKLVNFSDPCFTPISKVIRQYEREARTLP